MDVTESGSVSGWVVVPNDGTDVVIEGEGGVILSVSGQITIDLGGYVLLAGGFGVSKSSQSGVSLGANGTLDVDLLRIDLVDVDLFVGVGGVFDKSDPGHYAVDASAGTGFFVDGARSEERRVGEEGRSRGTPYH